MLLEFILMHLLFSRIFLLIYSMVRRYARGRIILYGLSFGCFICTGFLSVTDKVAARVALLLSGVTSLRGFSGFGG